MANRTAKPQAKANLKIEKKEKDSAMKLTNKVLVHKVETSTTIHFTQLAHRITMVHMGTLPSNSIFDYLYILRFV